MTLDYNLKAITKNNISPREKPPEDIEDLRHLSMLKAIQPYARQTEQKNLTPVYINYKTRKTKMVLVLCPEWAPDMPPFNLAKLSGIAKSAGYETTIIDLNIRTYNEYYKNWYPNNLISFTLFDGSASWRWLGSNYYEYLHPLLEPMLLKACDEIEKFNPDIVGFSVYYISEEPTKWMCQELKRRNPKIKIAIGGSNVQKSWFAIQPYYDYVVNGEGEKAILDILEEVENGVEHSETKYIVQPEDQRINLNGLPMPDYESIDFSQYRIPNGVNSEISRGCTAKCTFCEETHYWKYRQRQAVDLITEIEWLYYNKGTDVIWFIDSLVNGNLKELRAFCKAVEAKDLKIHWTGYARCDGRMDLEYFKDLKAGGCIMLNYGIESGSQNVLNAMDKGVTIAEMEQNFKDGKKVGIYAATNWIVGFPTETLQDFSDSMTFLWRIRNENVNNVGGGAGFGLGPETVVGQNPEKFNLSHFKYQGHWITKDFKFGGTHLMMRVKSFYMFLDLIQGCSDNRISYPKKESLARDHYRIHFDNITVRKNIEYENFNYDLIKPNINPFADTLVNQMWPFFRTLWKTRGGYTAEIKFNPDIDLKEFGTQYGPGMLNAVFKFTINDEGKWKADFNIKFDQVKFIYDEKESHRTPFYTQEFSRLKSNSAFRARKLAKPQWSLEEGRTDMEFWNLLQEEKKLNDANPDFSFEHHYIGKGHWGDHKKYEFSVTEFKKTNNESLVSIPISSIKKK